MVAEAPSKKSSWFSLMAAPLDTQTHHVKQYPLLPPRPVSIPRFVCHTAVGSKMHQFVDSSRLMSEWWSLEALAHRHYLQNAAVLAATIVLRVVLAPSTWVAPAASGPTKSTSALQCARLFIVATVEVTLILAVAVESGTALGSLRWVLLYVFATGFVEVVEYLDRLWALRDQVEQGLRRELQDNPE